MTEKVEQLLNKFKGDIIMLDALYQWANNQTGTTAISRGRYADHYPIKKNLAIRYNLSTEKAEEAYNTLKKEIDSAGLDFRKDFNEVNSEINIYFKTNDILKDTVLDRLVSATEEEKYIAWLYYHYFREGQLQENVFSARLHATFGTTVEEKEIVNTLIRLGLLNEIEWISSSGNHLDHFVFPKHYLSSIPPIEGYIQLPLLPDFEKYIDLLLEKKRTEALIALDYLLCCDNGCAQDGDKLRFLPVLPAIIARNNGCCAVNCRILEELRNYFYKRKSAEITEISKKMQEVLTRLVEVDISISFSEQEKLGWETAGNAKKIWDIRPLDRLNKDMLVVLTPWLSSSETGHLILDVKSKYVVIVTTMMGIHELNELYLELNQKDINESESDLIILDLSKDEMHQLVVRGKPKLYEEIIEGLRKPEPQKSELPGKPTEPATIKIRPKSEKYRDEVLDAVYHINAKSVVLTLRNGEKKIFNPERKNSSALSRAANYVTKSSINGWLFWEYYDSETNSWRLIDELRKDKRTVREVQERHGQEEILSDTVSTNKLSQKDMDKEIKEPQKGILVGFECRTKKAVTIKPAHLFISGVTQKAGKTTTLEALIHRSGLRAISFITKPGEKCFNTGHPHKPYFHGKVEWRSIEKLFESLLEEKIKDVRHKLIELCKKEKTLTAVKENIGKALENATKGSEKKPLILLQAYFDDLFKGLEGKEHVEQLDLKEGVNIMDLTDYTEELQAYIINSVLNEILNTHENIIVLIPEAWKFIPQSKRSSCKYPIEQLIRQGAVKNIFVWFDSQDIANVDKAILKNVSVWLLGLQTEINEVKHTIEQIPLSKKLKPTEDQIMRLEKGEFFLCADGKTIKVYVMPDWMEEDEAKNIAISKLPFCPNP